VLLPTSIRQRREHPAISAVYRQAKPLTGPVSIRIVARGVGQKVGRDPQQPPERRPAPPIAEPRQPQPGSREHLGRQVAGRPLDPRPQPSVHSRDVSGEALCEGGRVVPPLTQQDSVTALVVCVTSTHHSCVTPSEDQLLPLLPELPELPPLPAPVDGLVLGAGLLTDRMGQSET
jgi:hypothetical protein